MAFTLGMMPSPKQIERGDKTVEITKICSIKFTTFDVFPDHIIQLLFHYHQLITYDEDCDFEESIQNVNLKVDGALKFEISLESNEQLYWVKNTKEEAYELEIDENLNIKIQAQNHWGLARALDTVNQLAINNEIENLPIYISDEPQYIHRGVMIDTARNFLPVKLIKRTIDALVINKLNVLHWHITDDESFPLLLSNYSQITNNSKYQKDGYFTKEDVQDIIQYASIRAVQIIPEIDTPAHVHSWGRSSELSEIIITCDTNIKQYGQLDPTLEFTYEVLKSVMQDLNDMFAKVQFIHFGGDEASIQCFEQKPSIKEFMDQHGIANYFDLQVYYIGISKLFKKLTNQQNKILFQLNIYFSIEKDKKIFGIIKLNHKRKSFIGIIKKINFLQIKMILYNGGVYLLSLMKQKIGLIHLSQAIFILYILILVLEMLLGIDMINIKHGRMSINGTQKFHIIFKEIFQEVKPYFGVKLTIKILTFKNYFQDHQFQVILYGIQKLKSKNNFGNLPKDQVIWKIE
ncbi:unnamed protein product [Paramecium pentaurelia]|uniref:Beta-N-acetylhexosaminidase n=1 Tax=Paramecium pentaurelia TaxID=43138 RepID=A0A8S1SYH1_9CILI|nr:unnamed protein product [Paramecium pentaurelia]